MHASTLRIAWKVLLRRKFFTAVSLFGITFTLTVLLFVVALIDSMITTAAPEVHLNRTLHVSWMILRGGQGEDTWSVLGDPGYGFLDRYARGIPGVEKFSIYSTEGTAITFLRGERVLLRMRRTDGAYWEILRFRFLEGGPFVAEDDANGNHVAVISRSARSRLFGAGDALGRSVELDGRTFRVVGVVEDVSPTRLSASAEVWVPHGTSPAPDYRTRLTGGASALLLARSRAEFPGIRAEFASRLRHVTLEPPLGEALGTPMTRIEQIATHMETPMDGRPPVAKVLLTLAGIAAAFLVLPTVNLVSLNLSRILERSGEIGVRKAFGASPAHLLRQFLWENVLLSSIGGTLSIAASIALMKWTDETGFIPYAELHWNWRVFLYAVALAVLFGLLSGAVPAWRMSRLPAAEALRRRMR